MKESEVNLLFQIQKLKRYILRVIAAYSEDEIEEQDKIDLKHESNSFIVKGGAKNIETLAIDIERNFLSLISFLELDQSVSVLQFYAKLDYINTKNRREAEQMSKNGR